MALPPSGIKFPLIRPVIPGPDAWVPYLRTTYERRYFTNFGANEQLFGSRIAERFCEGDGEAVLACSATAALTAALIGLGVHGLVAVPGFTFPATIQAIIAAGCRPLVLDVDPVTWELSAETVEQAIKHAPVAAIMPVRVFGLVRDHKSLIDVAKRHNVPIIFDAAAALGHSRFPITETQPGYVEVFSLHATKSFAIGEGGVILCTPTTGAAIRKAMNFGLNEDRTFGDGMNGKMSEFQAAVGLAALEVLSSHMQRRREMASLYGELLGSSNSVALPVETEFCPWSVYPVLTAPGTDVPQLVGRAADKGVQLRRYYHPSIRTGYRGTQAELAYISEELPVSESLSERMICLPVYADLNEVEQSELSDIVRDIFASGP